MFAVTTPKIVVLLIVVSLTSRLAMRPSWWLLLPLLDLFLLLSTHPTNLSNFTRKVYTMNRNAAVRIWTMEFWLLGTALKRAKTSGSWRTRGVRNGVMVDSFAWLAIAKTIVVLRQPLAIQLSKLTRILLNNFFLSIFLFKFAFLMALIPTSIFCSRCFAFGS